MVRWSAPSIIHPHAMSTSFSELVNAETAWRVVVGMVIVAGRWFAGRGLPRGRRRSVRPRTI
jgi:hypothetical protein